MQKNYSLELERTPAMTLAGGILTNYYNGLIIITFITFLSIGFMLNTNFSLASLIFFAVFTIPVFFFAHFRLVMRGRRAMRKQCDILIDDDVLEYETGYPNILQPGRRTVKRKDITRIIVKGNPLYGYYLHLETKDFLKKKEEQKNISRKYQIPKTLIGLWRKPSDALDFANMLAKELKVKVDQDFEEE